MSLLVALTISVTVGIIAYILFSVFPPTKPYANLLALVAAIIAFFVKTGVIK